MSTVLTWAVVAGLGLGLGLWTLLSMAPALNRPRLARRVAPFLADVSSGARELLRPPPAGPLAVVHVLVEPLLTRGRGLLSSLLGGDETTRRRLRQAGSALSVEAFRSQQVLAAAGGAAAGALLGVAGLVAGTASAPLLLVAAAVFGLGGVFVREWMLQRTARARLARLQAELPVLLEFLALSLSAGEGLLEAVRRVARTSRGELAAELARLVASVGTGLPFAETLSRLAADLELPPFTRLTDQLLGALERGTPLAEVLRAQAQDAREEAKRELLEVAGKKEVGMLVPLVFLILPVTIVFAIFPGVFVLQLGF